MTFAQDMEETPVVFRKYGARCGGAVIALFPCEPWNTPVTCSCYVHVGQHGEADPWLVVRQTRAAKPEEYASLKRELESAPYGYRLKVYKRMRREFYDRRREALRLMNEAPREIPG
jgi:hypothetical protein